MKELSREVSYVNNQKSMAEFIERLANDYSSNKEDWVNSDFKSFLFAMSAWVEDMDSYYRNSGQPYDESNISWKNFADILMASRIYE